jgi:hypothetical protein
MTVSQKILHGHNSPLAFYLETVLLTPSFEVTGRDIDEKRGEP